MNGTKHRSIDVVGDVALSGDLLASFIVKPVITVGNATGGSTDAALTLQLNKLDGTPIDTARQVVIVGGALQYAPFAPSSTLSFVTATAGSIVYPGAGYAVVKTDATGAFACTARNTADETLYFMAFTAFGVGTLADSCIVLPGLQDAAAWSA